MELTLTRVTKSPIGLSLEPSGRGTLKVRFPFNRLLVNEIGCMEGATWNPGTKTWTIADSPRNWFQIDFLSGKNPYEHFETPLEFIESTRPLMKHQRENAAFFHTRHQCILASEMGTGKSLSAIEAMEASGIKDWIWVSPRSAMYSVMLECEKWDSKIIPEFMTYEGLVKLIEHWPEGKPAPKGVIFDEASKLKNPTAKRSIAAKHLADSIRKEYGLDGYVMLMSGSPAPKSPSDWWMLCEIAHAGFIREGKYKKFHQRLAIVEDRESASGGVYPALVAWRESEDQCHICGQREDSIIHKSQGLEKFHYYVKGTNEVAKLYRRMNGLVKVCMKKDCMDLPEKIYRQIECKPNVQTIRAARMLQKSAPRAATALIQLRELSDGFLYKDKKDGEIQCPLCHGNKVVPKEINPAGGECPNCKGTGSVDRIIRETVEVPCPKVDALIELLEEHEDYSRLVVYAGFTGSIDRVVKICHTNGWNNVIRVDGRGWHSFGDFAGGKPQELLKIFQDTKSYPKNTVFVGQPGAAGMGITLTASPSIIFYSNDFNAESRIQAEDRIHRPGCIGANIIDLFHLESDRLVYDNLRKKRDLQAMTMGQLNEAIKWEYSHAA